MLNGQVKRCSAARARTPVGAPPAPPRPGPACGCATSPSSPRFSQWVSQPPGRRPPGSAPPAPPPVHPAPAAPSPRSIPTAGTAACHAAVPPGLRQVAGFALVWVRMWWVRGWVGMLRCWAGGWRAGCALGACHAMRANIGAVGTDSLRSLWPPSLYHHISPTHTTITRDTAQPTNQPTNQLSRPNTQAAPQKCHPSDYLASSTSGPGLPLMRSALSMCTTP